LQLGRAELFLRGGDQTVVMLGVRLVAFSCNCVARGARVAGELLGLFGDARGRPADLHVWAV
jgi:hypothetical protein